MGRKFLGWPMLMAVALLNSKAVADPPSLMVGAADTACSHWIEARRAKSRRVEEAMLLSWVQGYVSGINIADMTHAVDLPDHRVIAAFLDKGCAAEPTSPIWIHARKLHFDLRRQQGVKQK